MVRTFQRVIVAFLVAGGVALVAGPGASGVSGAAPDPDFSLMVSPTRLIVKPKAIDDLQWFRVANKGRLPVDIVVNRANFTMDRDGKVIFEQNVPNSAAEWLEVRPSGFHLAPDQERQVAVRINPPARPDNGEHQVALLFVAPAGPGGGNIKLNRAIGTPLYITVPGPIDTSVRVHGLRMPEFAMGGPVEFGATVDNLGTIHRDFFGKKSLNVRVDGRDVPFPRLHRAPRDQPRGHRQVGGSAVHVHLSRDGVGLRHRRDVQPDQNPDHFPGHIFALLAGTAVAFYILMRLARRRYRRHLLGAARALHEQNRGDLDQNEKV